MNDRLLTPEISSEVVVTQLSEDDAAEFGPTLDHWLHPNTDISNASDLPRLVGPKAESERWITKVDGIATSHGALYVHDYRMGSFQLKIGVFGAIATAPEWRRRGHAAKIVKQLQLRARELKLDAVVLWDETSGYYERFGFVSAGREMLHSVDRRDVMLALNPGRVRSARPADRPAIQALHAANLCRTERTQDEWDAWWGIPNCHWYVLTNRGEIVAYAVLGKGNDFNGCIHEWSGIACSLPELVAGILDEQGIQNCFVMSAPWEIETARAFAYLDVSPEMGVLGMVWLPSGRSLARRMGRDEEVRDERELLLQLLGPLPESEQHNPLPLYLRGFDSM